MKPARAPRSPTAIEQLIVFQRQSKTWTTARFNSLPTFLTPDDLLVVNNAATIPASLLGKTGDGGRIEVRLVREIEPARWEVVLFGDGDWRVPTENRPAPPELREGDRIEFATDFGGQIVRLSSLSRRLVALQFDVGGAEFWTRVHAYGRPIQYSYMESAIRLWSVQTAYAAEPVAAEMPSAGRPLTVERLIQLRRKGIEIVHVTHSTGLSSTGEDRLDRALPMAEWSDISPRTIESIDRAKSRGGRIVAVGTSVARALEGRVELGNGKLFAGKTLTDLILTERSHRQVVDGILTGMHEFHESHYRLLRAFASGEELAAGWRLAETHGFQSHEFGDSCLILG